jgi:class 3 adenylate cyclase
MGMEKAALAARASYYNAMALITHLLWISVAILAVILVLPFVIPFIKDAKAYKIINTALSIDKSIYALVNGAALAKIAGKNIGRLIMIACVVFLGMIINWIQNIYRNKLANLRVRIDYEEWKSEMNIEDKAGMLVPLKKEMGKLKTSNKEEREELLKLFAETKRKLDSMGRDLAFLAIDVVDSAGMKQGEEQAAAAYDFMEYKRFVSSKLIADGSLKSTWTPDGVMSCFPNIDAAVKAARDIITGLDAFNKNVKTLRQDFKVRCGINQGYVHFDESVPLEEVSDRVIDIAGHMQKHAKPNTICIAKSAVVPLQDQDGFIPSGRVVDGYEVYIWESK